jgi:signal transduction histidine kinase
MPRRLPSGNGIAAILSAMMIADLPSPFLAPILAPLLMLAGLLSLRARRAQRAAEARAAAAERLAAARGRCLSLGAAELRGPGLVLIAEGQEGLGRQLLRISDDLSRLATEPGERAITDAPLPLGPVVDAAVTTVASQIRPGHRHWQVDPALRALTVRADRRALEGALAALLHRAAGHSREGDVVVLRHVLASETLAIVVEDEGDGLTVADMAADLPGVSTGTRGLDLGLSLARSLAVAHGGDIRLESAPGIGARAWLTLPRERLLEAA